MPVHYHRPIITFQVVLTDNTRLVSGFQSDTINNIVDQLHQTVVYIPHVGQVANGATFTLYGKEAQEVRDVYATEDEFAILKVIDNPTPPQANFTHTNIDDGVVLPVTIDFVDTSVTEIEGVVEWYWDFNGNAIDANIPNPSYTFTEAGTYTISLVVANAGGADKKVITLNIVESEEGEEEAPGVPLNLAIVPVVTHETVPLEWEEPEDSGSSPITHYLVQYKDNGVISLDDDFVDYDITSNTNIEVNGLNSSKDYSFRVAAVNDVGAGDFTSPVSQDTPYFPYPNMNFNLQLSVNPNEDQSPLAVFSNDPGDESVPCGEGDPIGVWGYNGGAFISGDVTKKPTFLTGIMNGDRTFNVVEFQGGTRLRIEGGGAGFSADIGDFDSGFGIEACIVQRRFSPIPNADRQTTGLWWITSEASPGHTDATDTHYPEDNNVIYERLGSGEYPRRNLFPIPIDLTEWHIYQIRGREGEWKMWLNGQLVINSSSNIIADAPISANPTIGVSYYDPPDNDADESAMWGGWFQTPEMVWFVPIDAEDQSITEEEAEDQRDLVTAQLLAYFADKYGIVLA